MMNNLGVGTENKNGLVSKNQLGKESELQKNNRQEKGAFGLLFQSLQAENIEETTIKVKEGVLQSEIENATSDENSEEGSRMNFSSNRMENSSLENKTKSIVNNEINVEKLTSLDKEYSGSYTFKGGETLSNHEEVELQHLVSSNNEQLNEGSLQSFTTSNSIEATSAFHALEVNEQLLDNEGANIHQIRIEKAATNEKTHHLKVGGSNFQFIQNERSITETVLPQETNKSSNSISITEKSTHIEIVNEEHKQPILEVINVEPTLNGNAQQVEDSNPESLPTKATLNTERIDNQGASKSTITNPASLEKQHIENQPIVDATVSKYINNREIEKLSQIHPSITNEELEVLNKEIGVKTEEQISLYATDKEMKAENQFEQAIQSQVVEDEKIFIKKEKRERVSLEGVQSENAKNYLQNEERNGLRLVKGVSDTFKQSLSKEALDTDPFISEETIKEYEIILNSNRLSYKEDFDGFDLHKTTSGVMRLGEFTIQNEMLRKTVLPSLTKVVSTVTSEGKVTTEMWKNHSFDLGDGNSIKLSTREVDGVIQLKLASSSPELNKLLQEYSAQIKEHLEKECNINIDLQFGNSETGNEQKNPLYKEFGQQRTNSASVGLESNNAIIETAQNSIQNSVRSFGYNQMEWTV